MYFGQVLRALFCLLLLLRLPASLLAQPLQLPVQSFTADQGLGGATITSLAQDPRGFLWVGTPDELLLCDGRQFRPFRYADSSRNPTSFRRAVVLPLDTTGFLLLHEEGAHQYHFQRGRLTPVPMPFSHATALLLQSFSVDAGSPDRYRFVSSTARGYYRPATRQWSQIQLFKALQLSFVTDAENKGASFIQSLAGTSKIQLTDPFTNRATDSFPTSFALSGGVRTAAGLLLLSKEAQPRLWWKPTGKSLQLLRTPAPPVSYLRAVVAGEFTYITAGASLFRFRPASGTLQEIQNEGGSPLIGRGIITQLHRSGNTLWLGTNASGLVHVSLGGPRFKHFRSVVPAHNFIHAILPDEGGFFTGAFYGAFVRYHPDGSFAEDLSVYLRPPYTKGETYYFNHLERLPNGCIFIVGGRSFYLFDPSKRSTTDLTEAYTAQLAAQGLSERNSPGRKTVCAAGNRSWWITETGGLALWALEDKGKSSDLRLRQYIPLPGPPPEGICYWQNDLWAATAGKLYRLQQGKIADSFSLPSKSLVTCLRPDRQGRLWIATESGLLVWQNGRVERFLSTETGLPNNHVYALLPDTAGWMWGSTNGGLFAVHTTRFEVRPFTGSEGLQGLEFNSGAAAIDRQGRFYFGGMGGTNVFQPAKVLQDLPAGLVTLTHIAAPDTVYYRYPGSASLPSLKLSYEKAHLQIAYTTAQTGVPAMPRYEYRLNPRERWTEAISEGELQLFLAPGHYRIQIRLKGQPRSVAGLAVSVVPPFYQTGLFTVLVLAGGVLLISAFLLMAARLRYRRRVAQLEGAERIQEEKERISRELHDELGARAALIAHNTGQLETAIAKGADLHPLLARIAGSSTDMLTALRETVWTLKQETVTAGSLWLRYKNFIAQLSATYMPLRFEIQEEVLPAEKVLHYTEALNALRILQEAAMNAVRHSGATRIRISVSQTGEQLCFSVTDNGSGFPFSQVLAEDRGNGLQNMKHRSAESRFDLQITTPAGGGTEVKLCI